MTPEAHAECEHEQVKSLCWLCMHPETEWGALQEAVPELTEAIEHSQREIASGKVIRFKRRTATGHEVVMPHSMFRQIVEALHDDKVRRGDGG